MAEKQNAQLNAWILGCGLGCGLILFIAVGLGLLGARLTRQTTRGFETAIETRKGLEERFGPTDAYVPPAGGLAPDRMEAFLAVREDTAPARDDLAAAWAKLPLSEEAAKELESQDFGDKMRSVFEITRSGIGLGAEMGELYEARNQALADAGIGLGEYTYIYVLAYYSWLGHSPTDGPDSGTGGGETRMGDTFFGRVRKDLLQMLRNGLDAAEAGDGWRQTLEQEIAALEADRRRLPWQDGLPEQVAASFEPFRQRLEASYNPATNAFELGRSRKRGRFSITAD